jgi:methylphosphotriester-DNA--protein-cysteine methyltransferase
MTMENLTNEEMLNAVRTNDDSYDGKFYVGVRTTGIYCLPSCRAKLPLVENIIFFRAREDAIEAGYRGCKRCRSAFFPDVSPEWLDGVLSVMREERTKRIDEDELARLAGVDISTIRRYFRSHLKTTPIAFHRKIRLEYAREMLEEGANYLEVAYACGFESASGFRDAFVKEYGHPPGGCNANRSNRL